MSLQKNTPPHLLGGCASKTPQLEFLMSPEQKSLPKTPQNLCEKPPVGTLSKHEPSLKCDEPSLKCDEPLSKMYVLRSTNTGFELYKRAPTHIFHQNLKFHKMSTMVRERSRDSRDN